MTNYRNQNSTMKTINEIPSRCPWCNGALEKTHNQDFMFIGCTNCEFELEFETQELIEDWKKDNIGRKVDKSVEEDSVPTTLVDCSVCGGDGDDCWCCLGSGTVWEDQYGKTIPKEDSHNLGGFDY